MLLSFPLPIYNTCALSHLSQASRTVTLPGAVGFSAPMLAGYGGGFAPGLRVLCAHTEVSKCDLALSQLHHWSETRLEPLPASQSSKRVRVEQAGTAW